MSVKVTRDGLKNLMANIRKMDDKRLLVGIPGEENPRKGDPIGNAQLGYIHENGSAVRNIPPRPFLKPGVRASRKRCVDILRNAAKQGFTNPAAVEQGLNAAGLVAQASVKNTLKAGEGFEPLKPSTLAARKRKGYKGFSPLIRTGQLMNSITYVIRDKK